MRFHGDFPFDELATESTAEPAEGAGGSRVSEPPTEAARPRHPGGACFDEVVMGGGDPERRDKVGEVGLEPSRRERGARGSGAFEEDRIARGKVGGTFGGAVPASASAVIFTCCGGAVTAGSAAFTGSRRCKEGGSVEGEDSADV